MAADVRCRLSGLKMMVSDRGADDASSAYCTAIDVRYPSWYMSWTIYDKNIYTDIPGKSFLYPNSFLSNFILKANVGS